MRLESVIYITERDDEHARPLHVGFEFSEALNQYPYQ